MTPILFFGSVSIHNIGPISIDNISIFESFNDNISQYLKVTGFSLFIQISIFEGFNENISQYLKVGVFVIFETEFISRYLNI